MPLTDSMKAQVLDYIYGGEPLVQEDTIWIGLSTTQPANNGSNFTEPSGAAGYARVELDNDEYTWNLATVANPSVKTNLVAIEFPEATGSWGQAGWFGIFTTIDGATPIEFAVLTNSKTATAGDALRFKAGELQIRLTNEE